MPTHEFILTDFAIFINYQFCRSLLYIYIYMRARACVCVCMNNKDLYKIELLALFCFLKIIFLINIINVLKEHIFISRKLDILLFQ